MAEPMTEFTEVREQQLQIATEGRTSINEGRARHTFGRSAPLLQVETPDTHADITTDR